MGLRSTVYVCMLINCHLFMIIIFLIIWDFILCLPSRSRYFSYYRIFFEIDLPGLWNKCIFISVGYWQIWCDTVTSYPVYFVFHIYFQYYLLKHPFCKVDCMRLHNNNLKVLYIVWNWITIRALAKWQFWVIFLYADTSRYVVWER